MDAREETVDDHDADTTSRRLQPGKWLACWRSWDQQGAQQCWDSTLRHCKSPYSSAMCFS
jgi:hypothetical protein